MKCLSVAFSFWQLLAKMACQKCKPLGINDLYEFLAIIGSTILSKQPAKNCQKLLEILCFQALRILGIFGYTLKGIWVANNYFGNPTPYLPVITWADLDALLFRLA